MSERRLSRFAWLAIIAAFATLALKLAAYLLTGSIGLLSDGVESFVNIAAALLALVVLTVAAKPADRRYEHGYEKAEYFSSGLEGGLIALAAVGIFVAAIQRMLHLKAVERIDMGMLLTLGATLINWLVARVLIRAAREHDSITLEAAARHLMTDIWTSFAVLIGIFSVKLTNWYILDPLIALGVAMRIVSSGMHLVRRSIAGLMDASLPDEERQSLERVLDGYKRHEMQWHALRTRKAGSRRFVTVHVLVPGSWSVQEGHDLLEKLEADLRTALPKVAITTHLEPAEDPVSFQDLSLDR